MPGQNYNQNDQSSWVGSADPGTGAGREAPLSGQRNYQQPLQGQQPFGNQGGGGLLNGPLSDVRQTVENQIYQAIDHYGNQVPGGHNFTPEAKNAVSGILDNLQRQLEGQAASRMGGAGGLGGGLFGEGGNNQSGQSQL